ncbi:HEAT repeat domain-containing protein [Paenibacillus sp. PSB04]|uniref:HEAT repeat domain-containing protein n=1 Tax=Paenibacillus sp. PSB04 TaxID=2866810 RepID=UPI0021F185B2|nr:HEAT repeat domain-containing protein [Paenibacillus sp. PSB04]UYO04686.1 HEAT repeat domain-containing protein [Paenibacillus sp. PSB04]
MNLNRINQLILSNKIDEALHFIEEIGKIKDIAAAPLLLELLTTTENHLIRNQTAIALSDMGCQEAVEPIIELLQDPKTLGYRGSLLYALEPLNYSKHIDILLEFVISGNFEVSRNSFLLLEQVKDQITPELKQKYRNKINTIIEGLEEEIEFLEETIEELNL